jgi:predicted CxxxxCH...CXXCH cytochrome family protein
MSLVSKGHFMIRYTVALCSIIFLVLGGCSQLTERGKNIVGTSACVGCHGVPPATGAHQFHKQKNIDCLMCHPGTGAFGSSTSKQYHNNGTVDVIPLNPLTMQPQGTYNPDSQTCSKVYCHGGGQKDTLGITWQGHPLRWTDTTMNCYACHDFTNHQTDAITNNGAQCYDCHTPTHHTDATPGKARCGVCHDIPPQDFAAHTYHVDSLGFDCNKCHAGYSKRDSTVELTTHMDGMTEVNAMPGPGSYNRTTKTCSNVSCHGSGQKDTLGLVWNINSISWADTVINCNACHDYTNHQTDAINNQGATCYDCHTPTFHSHATSGKANCGTCHGIPPDWSESHLYHVDTLGYNCNKCHAGYSKLDSTVQLTTHINGTTEVNALPGPGTYTRADQTCNSVYCHGNFTGGNHGTPVWDNGPVACGSCHNIPPSTGQHIRHMNRGQIDCSNCHAGYQSKGSRSVNMAHHANGKVDVDGTLGGGTYTNGSCNAPADGCHGGEAHSWNGGN